MADGDTQIVRRGLGWKGVSAVSLTVLLGGLILAGWLVTRFDLLTPEAPSAESAQKAQDENSQPGFSAIALDSKPSGANTDSDVAAKVAALEKRIAQIDQQDGAAVAFSPSRGGVATALRARRALDSGASLSFIQAQLTQRFGDRYPQAVDALQQLANEPVTLDELRDDIARRGDAVIGRGGEASLWSRIQLELGELFMLRERGEPSTSPAHILQRAEEDISKGDLKSAIEKIAALPKNDASDAWLKSARRYQNAKDALDRIERGALSQPVAAPVLVAPADVAKKKPAAVSAPQ